MEPNRPLTPSTSFDDQLLQLQTWQAFPLLFQQWTCNVSTLSVRTKPFISSTFRTPSKKWHHWTRAISSLLIETSVVNNPEAMFSWLIFSNNGASVSVPKQPLMVSLIPSWKITSGVGGFWIQSHSSKISINESVNPHSSHPYSKWYTSQRWIFLKADSRDCAMPQYSHMQRMPSWHSLQLLFLHWTTIKPNSQVFSGQPLMTTDWQMLETLFGCIYPKVVLTTGAAEQRDSEGKWAVAPPKLWMGDFAVY